MKAEIGPGMVIDLNEMMNNSGEWEELKKDGSRHYKTESVEPIDLYKAGGMLKYYAITGIIKYAYRNANRPIIEEDVDKIIHCAKMLKVLCHEGK